MKNISQVLLNWLSLNSIDVKFLLNIVCPTQFIRGLDLYIAEREEYATMMSVDNRFLLNLYTQKFIYLEHHENSLLKIIDKNIPECALVTLVSDNVPIESFIDLSRVAKIFSSTNISGAKNGEKCIDIFLTNRWIRIDDLRV